MKSEDRYKHAEIEAKWQKIWADRGSTTIDLRTASKPFYNLMMFPYPSAEGLHVGNMYAFTGSDIYGRYKRMQGYDVFEPIGLDGFGIHSENYALKVGRHPIEQAKRSQENFYRQLHLIGAMYDWTRTVETYNPSYYTWTQWLFLQMFTHGLAYRSRAQVNWCPSCKTVLADEQVIDGKCERCGNLVEKRSLEQWFFRITAYAGKLLENISKLDWSEKVLTAQRNWIGKKEGINITYNVVDEKNASVGQVTCFTTRPDTNFGATFVVLAPEHPFISRIQSVIKNKQAAAIGRYIENAKKVSSEERIAQGRNKTGVFTGLYCVNPFTGHTMPLYVSDFVVMGFGTGVVVGVPAHDERDYAFAKQFGLPIRKVVDFYDEVHILVKKQFVIDTSISKLTKLGVYAEDKGEEIAVVSDKDHAQQAITLMQELFRNKDGYAQIDGVQRGILTKQGVITQTPLIAEFFSARHIDLNKIWPLLEDAYPFCYTGHGIAVNSGFINGKSSAEALAQISKYIEEKGWGKKLTTYHLRDWLISRQRYWGPPIPMIYCEACAKAGKSWFTTKEANKSVASMKDSDELKDHMAAMHGWYPVPEKDLPVLLPVIEDYRPGNDGIAPLAKHKDFYNVACPACGTMARRETDVSDTFLDSSWYFLRYPSVGSATANTQPFDPEITKKWLPVSQYTGGAEHSVLHLMYSRFVTMALHDWGYVHFDEPFPNFYAHGLVIKDGAKMSKSKGNVVNPDEYIKLYGSDALRMYLMFMGPFSEGGDFRDSAMEGMSRWIGRVWRMVTSSLESGTHGVVSDNCIKALHKLVKKVGEDTQKRHYNTAIASMMEFTNLVSDEHSSLTPAMLKTFVLILAPYAPHLTEELYQLLQSQNYEGNAKKGKQNSHWSVHEQLWPGYDPKYLVEDTVSVVVQINGKLRDTMQIDAKSSSLQSEVEARAKASEKVQKYLEHGTVRKIVFIPGKLMNIVVS